MLVGPIHLGNLYVVGDSFPRGDTSGFLDPKSMTHADPSQSCFDILAGEVPLAMSYWVLLATIRNQTHYLPKGPKERSQLALKASWAKVNSQSEELVTLKEVQGSSKALRLQGDGFE